MGRLTLSSSEGEALSPTRSTIRAGRSSFVSTDVTSPQRIAESAGPTSTGERRSRTLRRVPSTQAISCCPARPEAGGGRPPVRGGPQGAGAAGAVGVGRPRRRRQEGSLGPAAPQGRPVTRRLMSAARASSSASSPSSRASGRRGQDAGPDPVAQECTKSVARGGERVQQFCVTLLNERAGGRSPGSESGRGDLDAEARRHDLLELVRPVER